MCGPGEGAKVGKAARAALVEVGLPGDVAVLRADRRGLVVGEAARNMYRTQDLPS